MPIVSRGAIPSPRHKLASAMPHMVTTATPPQFLWNPKQISMWANDQYGDCVTAEEAFAKACYSPEIFISDTEVIAWATQNGYLDDADRPEYPSHTIQDPELCAKAWDEYSAKSDAANRTVAEKFLDKVPQGHVLAEFEYSDNDGPYFTALEHGPLFMKLLHLRVSHH